MMGSMRTFGTDRRTDGQTDGGGFIRTPEGVLKRKQENEFWNKIYLETAPKWQKIHCQIEFIVFYRNVQKEYLNISWKNEFGDKI